MTIDPTRAPLDKMDDLSWRRTPGDAPDGKPGSFGEPDPLADAEMGDQGVTGRQAMGQTDEPDHLADAD